MNYTYFNLGMAALYNIRRSDYAHYEEKFAKLVYKYRNSIYIFKSLRKYKDKFDPKWESRYFAYKKSLSLTLALLYTTLFISKAYKSRK
jgi:phosphatidylglycerol lysyltransferase